MRLWWQDRVGNLVPGVVLCPAGCGTPIQRTLTGSVTDGVRKHLDYVHPGWPAQTLDQVTR